MVRNRIDGLLDEIDDTLDEWERRFDYDGKNTTLNVPGERVPHSLVTSLAGGLKIKLNSLHRRFPAVLLRRASI